MSQKMRDPAEENKRLRWELIALMHWDDRIGAAVRRAEAEYIANNSPPIPLIKYDYRREKAKKPRKAKKGVMMDIAAQLSQEVHGRLDVNPELGKMKPILTPDGTVYFNMATVDGRRIRVLFQEVDHFVAEELR